MTFLHIGSGVIVQAEQVADDVMNGEAVEAAAGTWRITYADGTVKYCHPSVFATEYEEA